MVPRAFLFSSAPPQKAIQPFALKEKPGFTVPPFDPDMHHTMPLRNSTNTPPVGIPQRRNPRGSGHRDARSRTPSIKRGSMRRSSSASSNDRTMPTAVASMLDATAIPVPRRTWSYRRPRKLPRGNHVEEFTRMMQEGVKAKEDYLAGTGNSPLDLLLSPPEEDNEVYATGHESDLATPCSVRSVSSDSMPSLAHDIGSPSSTSLPLTPGSLKSPPERRQLRYSTVLDQAVDHPLLETEIEEGELIDIDTRPVSEVHEVQPTKRATSFGNFPSLRSSFKSNLTASLRAIKSAAQSVSTFATPSVQPDDFLTRSLFTITPELTDDRRPPPMQDPPSPALRRYLNPTPISPAEMYVYHSCPHENPKQAQACVSIQMQTYRRSRGRGHQRNHFHVVSAKSRDQYSIFDPEIPPMSRQREPRENSDFLRVVVLEMNMRRCGKLRDDIPTRARIWLPPRKNNSYRASGDYDDCDNDSIPSRWVGQSA